MPRNKTKAETVDWNDFVHQPDPDVRCDFEDSTKRQVQLVKKNFIKYVTLL